MHWRDPEDIVAADGREITLEDVVRTLADNVARLTDYLLPGSRGIRGAQEIPGVRIYAQTASTTPTLIPGNQRRKRLSMHVQSGVQVFLIDDPQETTADGFPIDLGGTIDIECRENLWVVTASGTSSLRIFEEAS